jgi:glycosyltransferase involved in cell wall biosynthesis
MNREIIVSICCQTYNHKDFLAQCLEGFLMQKTNFTFEILLRDDASTDGTTEIVRWYLEKYPDIIVPLIYEENQYQKGVSPFLDNLKRAKGKYVAICEGDDYWTDPFKLQKQVEFLENNVKFYSCAHLTKIQSENGELLIPTDIWQDNIDKTNISIIEILNIKPPFHISSFMFNKKVFDDLYLEKGYAQIWGGSYSGDRILMFMFADNGRIGLLAENMSIYRRNAMSITHTELYKSRQIYLVNNYILWAGLYKCTSKKNKNLVKTFLNSRFEILSEYLIKKNKTAINTFGNVLFLANPIGYLRILLKVLLKRIQKSGFEM